MDKFLFHIQEDLADERIDKCLSLLMDTLSRSYIQKLIKDENVLVNNKIVKSNYKVKAEDEICFYLPPSIEPEIVAQDIPLNILFEDNDIIIINKPKGMVVHPAAGHYSDTLVNGLLYHCKDSLSGINGVMRPGIVHRIDMNTTGSLIVCKNDYSHNHIAEQLKVHSITRKYHAIVYGVLKDDFGTIDKPIGRSDTDRKKMAINAKNGRNAVTHYKVLKRFDKYTYIECQLETGRTHQIRVHLASIGHPILGDDVYSNRSCPFKLEGQTLHAKTIGFVHPKTENYMEFDAPLPDYFVHLLNIL